MNVKWLLLLLATFVVGTLADNDGWVFLEDTGERINRTPKEYGVGAKGGKSGGGGGGKKGGSKMKRKPSGDYLEGSEYTSYVFHANSTCGGSDIHTWEDGEDSKYGGIWERTAKDCQEECTNHVECAGYDMLKKNGACSFWKKGPLDIVAAKKTHCYEKIDFFVKIENKGCGGKAIDSWASGSMMKRSEREISECKKVCYKEDECAGFTLKADKTCGNYFQAPLYPEEETGARCYERLPEIKEDTCTETFATKYDDPMGRGKCEHYKTSPQDCGKFDTAVFKAGEMCCACGGGFRPAQCRDTYLNDWALPKKNCKGLRADECVETTGGPDFNPVIQCCICGGGNPGAKLWKTPLTHLYPDGMDMTVGACGWAEFGKNIITELIDKHIDPKYRLQDVVKVLWEVATTEKLTGDKGFRAMKSEPVCMGEWTFDAFTSSDWLAEKGCGRITLPVGQKGSRVLAFAFNTQLTIRGQPADPSFCIAYSKSYDGHTWWLGAGVNQDMTSWALQKHPHPVIAALVEARLTPEFGIAIASSATIPSTMTIYDPKYRDVVPYTLLGNFMFKIGVEFDITATIFKKIGLELSEDLAGKLEGLITIDGEISLLIETDSMGKRWDEVISGEAKGNAFFNAFYLLPYFCLRVKATLKINFDRFMGFLPSITWDLRDNWIMSNERGLFMGKKKDFGSLLKAICDGILSALNHFAPGTFECPEVKFEVRMDIFVADSSVGIHFGLELVVGSFKDSMHVMCMWKFDEMELDCEIDIGDGLRFLIALLGELFKWLAGAIADLAKFIWAEFTQMIKNVGKLLAVGFKVLEDIGEHIMKGLSDGLSLTRDIFMGVLGDWVDGDSHFLNCHYHPTKLEIWPKGFKHDGGRNRNLKFIPNDGQLHTIRWNRKITTVVIKVGPRETKEIKYTDKFGKGFLYWGVLVEMSRRLFECARCSGLLCSIADSKNTIVRFKYGFDDEMDEIMRNREIQRLGTLQVNGKISEEEFDLLLQAYKHQGETINTWKGTDYIGFQRTTRSGLTCQRWDSQVPHAHNVTNEYVNPNLLGNYCRNFPNALRETIWCYTTDPDVEWEFCDPLGSFAQRYTGQGLGECLGHNEERRSPVLMSNFAANPTECYKFCSKHTSNHANKNPKYFIWADHEFKCYCYSDEDTCKFQALTPNQGVNYHGFAINTLTDGCLKDFHECKGKIDQYVHAENVDGCIAQCQLSEACTCITWFPNYVKRCGLSTAKMTKKTHLTAADFDNNQFGLFEDFFVSAMTIEDLRECDPFYDPDRYQRQCSSECPDPSQPCHWCGKHQGQIMHCCNQKSGEYDVGHPCFGGLWNPSDEAVCTTSPFRELTSREAGGAGGCKYGALAEFIAVVASVDHCYDHCANKVGMGANYFGYKPNLFNTGNCICYRWRNCEKSEVTYKDFMAYEIQMNYADGADKTFYATDDYGTECSDTDEPITTMEECEIAINQLYGFDNSRKKWIGEMYKQFPFGCSYVPHQKQILLNTIDGAAHSGIKPICKRSNMCVDKSDSCMLWVNQGKCHSSAEVLRNCKASCGACDDDEGFFCAEENEECMCNGIVVLGPLYNNKDLDLIGLTFDGVREIQMIEDAHKTLSHGWDRHTFASLLNSGKYTEIQVDGSVKCGDYDVFGFTPAEGYDLGCWCKGHNECADKHYNCPQFAENNGCETNLLWMSANCRNTCGICEVTRVEVKNYVQDGLPDSSDFGGMCTCPDGSVYPAGAVDDDCSALFCYNGASGECMKRRGEWSKKSVTCDYKPEYHDPITCDKFNGVPAKEFPMIEGKYERYMCCPEGAEAYCGTDRCNIDGAPYGACPSHAKDRTCGREVPPCFIPTDTIFLAEESVAEEEETVASPKFRQGLRIDLDKYQEAHTFLVDYHTLIDAGHSEEDAIGAVVHGDDQCGNDFAGLIKVFSLPASIESCHHVKNTKYCTEEVVSYYCCASCRQGELEMEAEDVCPKMVGKTLDQVDTSVWTQVEDDMDCGTFKDCGSVCVPPGVDFTCGDDFTEEDAAEGAYEKLSNNCRQMMINMCDWFQCYMNADCDASSKGELRSSIRKLEMENRCGIQGCAVYDDDKRGCQSHRDGLRTCIWHEELSTCDDSMERADTTYEASEAEIIAAKLVNDPSETAVGTPVEETLESQAREFLEIQLGQKERKLDQKEQELSEVQEELHRRENEIQRKEIEIAQREERATRLEAEYRAKWEVQLGSWESSYKEAKSSEKEESKLSEKEEFKLSEKESIVVNESEMIISTETIILSLFLFGTVVGYFVYRQRSKQLPEASLLLAGEEI